MPLMVCRGSDLLGPYVGQTEQNIAAAFQRAEDDGALLLIDEVDTFLAERGAHRQGWENSVANEFLTATEMFLGVLVATTNRLDALDQACVRRFEWKVGLRWLKPDQLWKAIAAGCEQTGLAHPGEGLRKECDNLTGLALGDVAALLRRAQHGEVFATNSWIAALEFESQLKRSPRRRVGFI